MVAGLEGDAGLGADGLAVDEERSGVAGFAAEEALWCVGEAAGDGVEFPLAGGVDGELDGLAESAGFSDVNVTLELSSTILSPFILSSWDQVMMMSPNPNAPTYGEAIHQALTSDEAQRLERHLRPLMERGAKSRNRAALAYLTATKPSS